MINVGSGKALEVSRNATANAALIDQWDPASSTPPQFSSVSTSGADLLLNCASGVPGIGYSLLASTNLTLPTTNWAVLSSINAGAQGNFAFSNALSAGQTSQFFKLELQPTNGAANQQWTFRPP